MYKLGMHVLDQGPIVMFFTIASDSYVYDIPL